jgi:hypothetical protein
MIQEIKYQGLSATPDDYQAPDGSLEASLNLINEDNAIKPLFKPDEICNLPSKCSIVFIHKTASFTHYIVQRKKDSDNDLLWFDSSVITNSSYHPTPSITVNSALTLIHRFSDTVSDQQVPVHILDINAIGNTLLFLAEDGIHYCLWKGDSQGYLYLGTHLPELPLSFGLQGTPKKDYERVYITNHDNHGATHMPSANETQVLFFWDYNDYADGKCTELSNTILGNVNKFINKEATSKGKFIFPFLVRYAYRLYDGSLTMHSAPVLMVTSSGMNPIAFITRADTVDNGYGVQILDTVGATIAGVVFDLDYACIDSAAKTALQNWSDIVKSVDIFISAPIYTYDQAGRVEGYQYKDSFDDEFTVSLVAGLYDTGDPFDYPIPSKFYYRKTPIPTLLFDGISNVPKCRLILPTHNDEYIKNSICDNANFYLLKSIKLDDIQTSRTKIDVPEDYLQSLVARERMSENNYDSHDLLVPSLAFVYNYRLNIANILKKLAMPFNPATAVPFCNIGAQTFHYTMATGEWSFVTNNNTATDIFVKIGEDGKVIVMKSPSSPILSKDTPLIFFYYPNANADKAFLVKEYESGGTTTKNVLTLPLEKHANLNGAFFFAGWNPTIEQTGWVSPSSIPQGTIPTVTTDNTVTIPNKLYTSEVNNPFAFPASGINTIGTGTILGLSAAAKALSQGQFGQFPLYAFCSDGVWALEVSQTGSFSARQPITRDVCSNPDSITQLDNAVLFASDRGIMLLAGSETTCISDIIADNHPLDIASLPGLPQLTANLGWQNPVPFLQFISDCQMLYDYIHQHIIVFNPTLDAHNELIDNPDDGFRGYDPETGQPIYDTVPDSITVTVYSLHYTYAYVYSLKSKLWGVIRSNIVSTLNSYPDALAMNIDGKMVSLSNSQLSTFNSQLFITRPLKLGSADTLKSVHNLIQRGLFQRGDVKTLLYGSRDLYHWHLIATSSSHMLRNLHGSPYKYFRIASIASLSDGKSVAGVTVDAENRLTNTLR